MASDTDIEMAYSTLGIVDSTASDSEIIMTVQSKFSYDLSAYDSMRQALRTIADARQSVLIEHFLNTGEGFGQEESFLVPRLPSTEIDLEHIRLPAGIQNNGNTCYLNSLLQFYFSVTPLRNMILGLEDENEISCELIFCIEIQLNLRF